MDITQPNFNAELSGIKVKDHHIAVLNGLNQLRNDGRLLDVTLWAENRPFQVGFQLILLKAYVKIFLLLSIIPFNYLGTQYIFLIP